MIRLGLSVLDEVPTIAIEIFEHGDQAVGLLGRWPNESNSIVHHSMVVAPEIIRRKEEKHPPARLVSDKRLLLRLGRLSESIVPTSSVRVVVGRSRWRRPPSLAFQSISPGNYLEFAADGFLDRNDGSYLEHESRKHRTKLVNGHEIVALEQHVAAPFANSYHEEFDLEIGGRLPLTEHLEDSLLRILVLEGRTLRAFGPADHVFHRILLVALLSNLVTQLNQSILEAFDGV